MPKEKIVKPANSGKAIFQKMRRGNLWNGVGNSLYLENREMAYYKLRACTAFPQDANLAPKAKSPDLVNIILYAQNVNLKYYSLSLLYVCFWELVAVCCLSLDLYKGKCYCLTTLSTQRQKLFIPEHTESHHCFMCVILKAYTCVNSIMPSVFVVDMILVRGADEELSLKSCK